MTSSNKLIVKVTSFAFLSLLAPMVFAANYIGNSDASIATMAASITTQASAIAKLLSVSAYIGGVAFSLAGILQFKGHKENPQQIPLSKPVVMIIVAACLLYLPTLLNVTGVSLFGTRATSAANAGGMDGLGGL